MRTLVGARSEAVRWRHALVAVITAMLLAAGTLVGLSVAAAQASDDTTEEISPEQYPPPSQPEETVTPKPPVSAPPELVRTGVQLPWAMLAAGGVGLILIGGGLRLARRKLSSE